MKMTDKSAMNGAAVTALLVLAGGILLMLSYSLGGIDATLAKVGAAALGAITIVVFVTMMVEAWSTKPEDSDDA